MNFDFSEEQQMVRDSIARFVQDDYDWDTRKAIVASDKGMSRDNWQLFRRVGLAVDSLRRGTRRFWRQHR